ncbi:hypothetical protein BAUCODRAFT_38641 [Baudoinia panamericana UAMH 10762]|uniref:Uncharacterized protein n=1 Tax=Baudoinia panamericana (strain UAMH 10762) TaxID=717646 RepID=M2LC70_BAUPA|nr:uncharacterized protein BAUCODRAFT_38641 [Baudoinia panamericana UAMH 10762]EMC91532.1 hypothetical protein BAUCODRAFT_38641 [Baudoinia panamericana UAMH 10762]
MLQWVLETLTQLQPLIYVGDSHLDVFSPPQTRLQHDGPRLREREAHNPFRDANDATATGSSVPVSSERLPGERKLLVVSW